MSVDAPGPPRTGEPSGDFDDDGPGLGEIEPPSTPDWSDPDVPNYFFEIEMRRFLTSAFPDYDFEADLKRAAHYDPETDGPYREGQREVMETLESHGVRFCDDKVVIPLDVDGKQEVPINRTVSHGTANSERDFGVEKLWSAAMDVMEFGRDPRPVYIQFAPGEWNDPTTLDGVYDERCRDNRDLKVHVTARDSQTGTGKTTLACILAHSWDQHGWNADKATLKGTDYQEIHEELPEGSVVLLDEAEIVADNRRSMSGQNVSLTHLWSTMRVREVHTICTLPSVTMLDKRLKELADVRIHVQQRGVAVAYKSKVDDHSAELREHRMHRIRWGPIDEDDAYQDLAQKKRDRIENYQLEYGDDDEEETISDARDRWIRQANDVDGVTQEQIGEIFDLSRSAVSKIASADPDDDADD